MTGYIMDLNVALYNYMKVQ